MTTPSIARIGKGNNPGRHESRVLGEFLDIPARGQHEVKCPWPSTKPEVGVGVTPHGPQLDRKSTRLNSSHSQISYAVFCLKKKNRSSRCYISVCSTFIMMFARRLSFP